MHTVIDVVLPVFALIIAGYGFSRTRFLSREGARGLGNFVYYCAIPAVLFLSLARAAPGGETSVAVLGAYFIGTLIVFAGSMAIGRVAFGLGLAEQGLMGMSAAFSNSVQLGIPIVLTAFGPAGLQPLTLIVSVHALILLSLATAVIEIGRGGGGIRHAIKAAGAAIATNPVILAIVAGALWGGLGLAVPAALGRFLGLLGDAAAPAALFSLGATLSGFRIGGDLRQSLVLVALKLVALPLIVWLLATGVFHLSPLDTAVATTCAALPTGANAFILAQRYETYLARAASSVVISSALSMASLAALLAWFGAGRP